MTGEGRRKKEERQTPEQEKKTEEKEAVVTNIVSSVSEVLTTSTEAVDRIDSVTDAASDQLNNVDIVEIVPSEHVDSMKIVHVESAGNEESVLSENVDSVDNVELVSSDNVDIVESVGSVAGDHVDSVDSVDNEGDGGSDASTHQHLATNSLITRPEAAPSGGGGMDEEDGLTAEGINIIDDAAEGVNSSQVLERFEQHEVSSDTEQKMTSNEPINENGDNNEAAEAEYVEFDQNITSDEDHKDYTVLVDENLNVVVIDDDENADTSRIETAEDETTLGPLIMSPGGNNNADGASHTHSEMIL